MDKSQAIIIAARWWANQLRKPPKSSAGVGAGVQSAMFDWAASQVEGPTEAQINNFQAALEVTLTEKLTGCAWDEGRPNWDGASRTVDTNWNPAPCLEAAAQQAGISTLLLPIYTMMWIDPDGVKVRLGYSGQVEILPGSPIT